MFQETLFVSSSVVSFCRGTAVSLCFETVASFCCGRRFIASVHNTELIAISVNITWSPVWQLIVVSTHLLIASSTILCEISSSVSSLSPSSRCFCEHWFCDFLRRHYRVKSLYGVRVYLLLFFQGRSSRQCFLHATGIRKLLISVGLLVSFDRLIHDHIACARLLYHPASFLRWLAGRLDWMALSKRYCVLAVFL